MMRCCRTPEKACCISLASAELPRSRNPSTSCLAAFKRVVRFSSTRPLICRCMGASQEVETGSPHAAVPTGVRNDAPKFPSPWRASKAWRADVAMGCTSGKSPRLLCVAPGAWRALRAAHTSLTSCVMLLYQHL